MVPTIDVSVEDFAELLMRLDAAQHALDMAARGEGSVVARSRAAASKALVDRMKAKYSLELDE